MKVLIQRVLRSQVVIEGRPVAKIGPGLCVFVGFGVGESEKNLEAMAMKLVNFRIFADQKGKMNRSVLETDGEILLVPQFTLYADTSGRRPGFTPAAPPEKAQRLFDLFVAKIQAKGVRTAAGVFGRHMQIELLNDGPATFLLEDKR